MRFSLIYSVLPLFLAISAGCSNSVPADSKDPSGETSGGGGDEGDDAGDDTSSDDGGDSSGEDVDGAGDDDDDGDEDGDEDGDDGEEEYDAADRRKRSIGRRRVRIVPSRIRSDRVE